MIQIKTVAHHRPIVAAMEEIAPGPDLHVAPLVITDIRALFPLMLQAEPGLELTEWMRYARRLAARRDGRAGILVARRHGRAFPCGAVCYRQDHDLRYGQILIAEHFIALDLLYPQAVIQALVDALDVRAGELGCVAIRSVIHGGRPDLVEDLSLAGHTKEGTMLLKRIPAHAVADGE